MQSDLVIDALVLAAVLEADLSAERAKVAEVGVLAAIVQGVLDMGVWPHGAPVDRDAARALLARLEKTT